MDISSALGGQAQKSATAGDQALKGTEQSENLIPGFGKDGFTFFDFLDIVNPLQHIPLVSTLYRSMTGDEIDPGAKIAGGTLFGGPIGAAVSIADVAMEESTGLDFGGHAMAMFDESAEEIANLETAAGSNSAAELAGLTFAPGPGVEISQWAATANTGGINWSNDLRVENGRAKQSVDLAALTDKPQPTDVVPQEINTPARPAMKPVQQSNLSVLQALASDLKQSKAAAMAVEQGNTGAIVQASHERRPAERDRPTTATPQAVNPGSAGMGWFSKEMAAGLARYHEAQKLSAAERGSQPQS